MEERRSLDIHTTEDETEQRAEPDFSLHSAAFYKSSVLILTTEMHHLLHSYSYCERWSEERSLVLHPLNQNLKCLLIA